MLPRRLLLAALVLLGACTGGSDTAADATGASGGTDSDGSTSVAVLGSTATDTTDGAGVPGPGDSSRDDPARGDDAADGTSSTTAAPSSGTTPLPTVAPSPTTGPRSPAPAPAASDDCRTPAIPPGERSEPVNADLDGDGSEDQVFTVQHDEFWAVVATFGAGGGALIDLVGVDPRSFVRVVGGADIMGTGVDDLVVVTSVGAYTQQVGFVRLSDCDLLELAFEDSSPARFLTGASVNNGEALACPGDGTLERIHFTAIAGSDEDGDPEFEGGFEPFLIEDDVVKRLAPDGGTDSEADRGPDRGEGIPAEGVVLTLDDVSAIALFDCLGLEL